ncbi:MFS transporter [Burkholderia pseudomultivorans]|uniref:MFS transporter n=1 Tax=Burkholderia pseudomultivorans TaxID=1207504 RepID=UPI00075AE1E8|nr:MFS transporter [Burkholderia pseudomultivorans]AOI94107.1 MFS transporter [Burkholderia pseudomultivorans]KVC27737.1 MFS transporter [Burkholderia pseudomultivorans]KVC36859.1 MFS transporter [Burkholderia pseudomultivorans]KVC42100.1 MFS transporter [Burkholderia pseudomultivorans]
MKNVTNEMPPVGRLNNVLAAQASLQTRIDGLRSWYVLIILMLAYSLAYIDRQILNLLVDPIRHSLVISDTQLSLVQGIAFISAYLLASPLFGRLVDITNRRNILLIGVCLWSIFTALCGTATTFEGLFLARFGVGASEACMFPIALSVIADCFSAKRMPRAMSVFVLGPLLGGGLSLVAGGLVISFARDVRQQFPMLAGFETWQLAFIAIGLPGLLFALLVLLTVREPIRRNIGGNRPEERQFSVRESASFLWERRGFYVRLFIGVGMLAIVVLGMPTWLPTYLIRTHGMPAAVVGFRFGSVVVTFGIAGALLGPLVVRWLERRGYEDATLRTAAIAMVPMLLCCASIPFATSATCVLAAAAGTVFFFSLPTGCLAAALQYVAPSRMRGTVGALYTFFAQLIGFGLGPTLIAMVTDRVYGNPKMVGNSIGIICTIASALAAWLLLTALPQFRRLLAEARAERAD